MSSTGLLLIDTKAIVANWRYINSQLTDENLSAKTAAVVKANAYGLGVEPVARALKEAGCLYFFVATLQEAIELRDIIGDAPDIYVLGGLSHGCSEEWVSYRLIPVLFDTAYVENWLDRCRHLGRPLPCALKMDTGMHRLGLSAEELHGLVDKKNVAEQLNVTLLMSHLACADHPEHPLNEIQLDCFMAMHSRIKSYFPRAMLSLANSSGVFLGHAFHFDLLRPGAALYGVNPNPAKRNPMKSVVKLQLPVMQVRAIEMGESVGYGATFSADKNARIAVVFGGYADGLLRLLGNQGFGFCRGVRVPIVGRVSMDSMAFDVTGLDFVPDVIEILNDQQSVDDLAAYADTIGYEILTSLGSRYQRQYVEFDNK